MSEATFDDATVELLLTRTRSVRRRLDLERPVPREVVEDCLRVAVQAPTGSNAQRWRWIVVTDRDRRAALADLYARAFRGILADGYLRAPGPGQEGLLTSAEYLIDHLAEVPVLVVPCVLGRLRGETSSLWMSSHYGSVYPAVWNFALAARARGLGTCLTTAHLTYEEEAAEILGVPFDRMTQVCLLPVAYTLGTDFKIGKRRPLEEVVFWEEFDASTLVEGRP